MPIFFEHTSQIAHPAQSATTWNPFSLRLSFENNATWKACYVCEIYAIWIHPKDFFSLLDCSFLQKKVSPETVCIAPPAEGVQNGLTMCHKFSHIVQQNEANVTWNSGKWTEVNNLRRDRKKEKENIRVASTAPFTCAGLKLGRTHKCRCNKNEKSWGVKKLFL